MDSRVGQLRMENERLRSELLRLQSENDFLLTHPTIAAGVTGETLVANLTDGSITKYAERYDVLLNGGEKIEVKFSRLNSASKKSPTKRWNWGRPLGSGKEPKKYDYLVLIGEKDERYLSEYLPGNYVYFLIPYRDIASIASITEKSNMIQVNTNLSRVSVARSLKLKEFLVHERQITDLIGQNQG